MPAQETERRIAGRYLLQSRLGGGGMGVIWRAEDTLLQRPVAVKEVFFLPGLSDEERAAARARVMREARAAARINHRHAVTVFDVVEEDDHPFIVMELVDAPTLDEVVERDGPLPPERVADIGLDVLGALDAAHRVGIVHRDVKPGNVLVGPTGAKLGDFGIASIKDDPRLTATGLVVGSPSFMAPEQARDSASQPASDLWSLGATMYYAVEGRPPFDKGEAIPTLTSVVHDDPRPPERAGPLAPVLADLLVKEPAARPSTRELETRLRQVAGRPAVAARQAPARTSDTRPDRHGVRNAIIGLVAVLAVGTAAALLFGTRGERGHASGPGGNAGTPATTTPSDARARPAGWVGYTDPRTGYEIDHPRTWTVVKRGNQTDFKDPGTGAYLRVEWTDTPGPSPEGAWRTFAPQFAKSHQGYRELRIQPTRFQGFPAAEWEFLYTARGAELHAVDLGFVTGAYGFALNFQTRSPDWQRLQDTFAEFKRAFRPPEPQ